MAFILCMRLFMFYKGVLPEPGNTTVTAIILYAYSVSSIELLKNNKKIYIFESSGVGLVLKYTSSAVGIGIG